MKLVLIESHHKEFILKSAQDPKLNVSKVQGSVLDLLEVLRPNMDLNENSGAKSGTSFQTTMKPEMDDVKCQFSLLGSCALNKQALSSFSLCTRKKD